MTKSILFLILSEDNLNLLPCTHWFPFVLNTTIPIIVLQRDNLFLAFGHKTLAETEAVPSQVSFEHYRNFRRGEQHLVLNRKSCPKMTPSQATTRKAITTLSHAAMPRAPRLKMPHSLFLTSSHTIRSSTLAAVRAPLPRASAPTSLRAA